MAEKVISVSAIQQRHDTYANWTNKNPVLLDGEQITVVLEDGSTLHKTGYGGKRYAELPFDNCVVPKTLAEYNALPEEEKQSETVYLVTDDNEGGSGGDSGGSGGEVYSTEETRIGTWIDGKPLYRKVTMFTVPSSEVAIQNVDNCTEGNVDLITNVLLTVNRYGTVYSWPFGNYRDIRYVLTQSVSTGIYQLRINYASTATFEELSGGTVILIVEYTKTTDQPEVS